MECECIWKINILKGKKEIKEKKKKKITWDALSFIFPSSRKTECIQNATLTIPNRRFRDKAERDEHVNLEKWWTYACESRCRHLWSRRARWGLPKLFPLDSEILLFFSYLFEGGKGRMIDEIDLTGPGIERWQTIFAVSRHPLSWFPNTTPPPPPSLQIDSHYSPCVGDV